MSDDVSWVNLPQMHGEIRALIAWYDARIEEKNNPIHVHNRDVLMNMLYDPGNAWKLRFDLKIDPVYEFNWKIRVKPYPDHDLLSIVHTINFPVTQDDWRKHAEYQKEKKQFARLKEELEAQINDLYAQIDKAEAKLEEKKEAAGDHTAPDDSPHDLEMQRFISERAAYLEKMKEENPGLSTYEGYNEPHLYFSTF